MIPRTNFVESWYDSESYKDFNSKFFRFEAYYRNQLEEIFQLMVEYWKLYTATRKDPRKKDEQWRANVWIPHAYSGTATKVGAVKDIILSGDPIVEARPVGDEDANFQKSLERLIEHAWYINRPSRLLGDILTAKYVQGTDLVKVSYGHDYSDVPYLPSEVEWNHLAEQMAMAQGAGGMPPPPMTEFDAWRLWRDETNKAFQDRGIYIPENPMELVQRFRIDRFRGPRIERVPIWNARFDPFVEGTQNQRWFAVRSTRRYSELEALAGDAWSPQTPFSAKMIAKARQEGNKEGERERFLQWEQEVQEMLYKTSEVSFSDPIFDDLAEVYEVYTPFDEIKYTVYLNRQYPINWDPRVMPYDHQEIPYHFIRNIRIPGQALGMSDYAQTKELFKELMSLRNLRLDAVTLRVLPVLLRTAGVSIPEMQQKLRPGNIVDVNRADGLKPLMDAIGIPSEIFREDGEIKADIDAAMGTSGNVRGQQATLNRVSAAEATSRLEQALGRLKDEAESTQEELLAMVPQIISIFYQFFEADEVVKIAGEPNFPVRGGELRQALERDFRFRGATEALTRDTKVQQLLTLGEKFAASMSPAEMREIGRRIAEAMGMKNIDQMLSEQITSILEQGFRANKEVEKTAAELQLMQLQMQQRRLQMQMQGPPMPPEAGGPPAGPPPGGDRQYG